MRLKFAAWGILVIASFDVLLVVVAHYMGWLTWPAPEESLLLSLVMPLSLLLLLLSMIGALTLILTGSEGSSLSGLDILCDECGREQMSSFAFCHHCGATA
ncbi:MAG: hypothetical protein KY455_09845 [Euryarchaeota archaeon]|nr:hypothetical protein [Euryarchaeota archaeon]